RDVGLRHAVGHDADANAAFGHPADGVEAGDLDAQAQRAAGLGGGALHLGQDGGAPVQADLVVLQRLFEAQRAPVARQTVPRVHDAHQRIGAIGAAVHVACRIAAVEQAQVGAVGLQHFDGGAAGVFFEIDAHARVALHEAVEV